MEKFVITGKKQLNGSTKVSGAKNVALKAIVAACLTDEEVIIRNIPLISDLYVMVEIIEELGGQAVIEGHTITVRVQKFASTTISLDRAAHIRTSVMFLSPLLAREGKAVIPNPGGCRIGARPIDRTIDGLTKMGVDIRYESNDGYFYAKVISKEKLSGVEYTFEKNTHTGTETLMLAAVLASGKTVLRNTAQEPEIDELIQLLTKMGAKIKRTETRTIEIEGVDRLHGADFEIGPDRNEIVTIAIAAVITKGDILVENAHKANLDSFLPVFSKAGGGYDIKEAGIRFFYKHPIQPVDVITAPAPGFMTDWQGPWVILMTQASGLAVVHETVYENRFGYVYSLRKMGAAIQLFNPEVEKPEGFYNFNLRDDQGYFHAVKITGPVNLHNAVVEISDLRAGATLVLAALAAEGTSTIYGLEHLDRGYETFEERLRQLGASIQRIKED